MANKLFRIVTRTQKFNLTAASVELLGSFVKVVETNGALVALYPSNDVVSIVEKT